MNKTEFRVVRWQNGYAPNPAMLRLLMEREGFMVVQFGGRPEAVFSRHKNFEDQSTWIVSGALEVTVDGIGTYVLEPGDRDFLPAEIYHTARVVSEEAIVYLVGKKVK